VHNKDEKLGVKKINKLLTLQAASIVTADDKIYIYVYIRIHNYTTYIYTHLIRTSLKGFHNVHLRYLFQELDYFTIHD
jgi:hypothetical protein